MGDEVWGQVVGELEQRERRERGDRELLEWVVETVGENWESRGGLMTLFEAIGVDRGFVEEVQEGW